MLNNSESAFDFRTVHPLSLRFKDAAKEEAYLSATQNFRHIQMRWALLMVGVLYSLSAALGQTLIASIVQPWFSYLHLAQGVSYILLSLILFKFVRSQGLLYGVIILTMCTSWIDNSIITFVGETDIYFPVVYFMLIWGWLISGFPLALANRLNLIFLICLETLTYHFSTSSMEALALHHLFLLVTVTLGGLGCYLLEYHKRQGFHAYQATLEAKRQAEEAIKTKDKFFSIISHDLRGPIGNMSVLFNDIYKQVSEIPEDIYAILQASSKNVFLLLENLLTWSSSQKGELEFHPSDFALGEAMQNYLQVCSGQALHKGIRIIDHCPPQPFCAGGF